MQPSRMKSIRVPAFTPTVVPRPLASSGDVPTRVAVRNISAVVIVIAFNMSDVTPEITSEVYELVPLAETVFVLSPRQTLYAVAKGAADGAASVAISEALPLV